MVSPELIFLFKFSVQINLMKKAVYLAAWFGHEVINKNLIIVELFSILTYTHNAVTLFEV